MRKVFALILLLLVAAAVWSIRSPKQERGEWVTFFNTCPVSMGGKRPIGSPGSWVIDAKQDLVLRTYFIDKGEKALKSTNPLGPEDFPQVYATPLIDREGQTKVILYGEPTVKGLNNGKKRIADVIEFPVPDQIYSVCYSGSVGGNMKEKGEEIFMFGFGIAKTEHGGGKPVTSVEEMVRSSKEDEVSYVVFTCAAK